MSPSTHTADLIASPNHLKVTDSSNFLRKLQPGGADVTADTAGNLGRKTQCCCCAKIQNLPNAHMVSLHLIFTFSTLVRWMHPCTMISGTVLQSLFEGANVYNQCYVTG